MLAAARLAEQTSAARDQALSVLGNLRRRRSSLSSRATEEVGVNPYTCTYTCTSTSVSSEAQQSVASSSVMSSPCYGPNVAAIDHVVRFCKQQQLQQRPSALTSDEHNSPCCPSPALRRVRLSDCVFDESSDDGDEVWAGNDSGVFEWSSPTSPQRSPTLDQDAEPSVTKAAMVAGAPTGPMLHRFVEQLQPVPVPSDQVAISSRYTEHVPDEPEQQWRTQLQSKFKQQCCEAWRTTEEAAFLDALRQDVATWLSSLLNVDVRAETLLEDLANGVVLCRLAAVVEVDQTAWYQQQGTAPPQAYPFHQLKPKFSVQPGSYYARDNVAKFVSWTRFFNVPVTFEVSDLVDKTNEKNVIYCLVDVARHSKGLDMVPQLIELEREIDAEERDCDADDTKHVASQDVVVYAQTTQPPESSCGSDSHDARSLDSEPISTQAHTNLPAPPSLTSVDTEVRPNTAATKLVEPATPQIPTEVKASSPDGIDDAVQKVVNQVGARLKRVKKGKYVVAKTNKNLFVRILNKQVVVRVGGGWDTLKNYLATHESARAGLNAGLLLKDGPDCDARATQDALLRRASETKLKQRHLVRPVKDVQLSVAMPVKAQTPQSDRMTTAKKGAKYGAESDDVLLCSYDQAPSAYRRTSVSHPGARARQSRTGPKEAEASTHVDAAHVCTHGLPWAHEVTLEALRLAAGPHQPWWAGYVARNDSESAQKPLLTCRLEGCGRPMFALEMLRHHLGQCRRQTLDERRAREEKWRAAKQKAQVEAQPITMDV
eukprot:m.160210 g.160210  ORF g.160210 m.160210 type:complete len:769 (-) comp17621_c1_seq7:94-2400(-)